MIHESPQIKVSSTNRDTLQSQIHANHRAHSEGERRGIRHLELGTMGPAHQNLCFSRTCHVTRDGLVATIDILSRLRILDSKEETTL